MPTRQKLGQLLQGFSAGVAGRGPEFIQGLADNRKQALLDDAFTVQQQLQGGDVSGARGTLLNRLQAIEQLGGNPADTDSILLDIERGDIDKALQRVGTVVDFGVASGRLQAPAKAIQPKTQIVDGQLVTIAPGGGSATATPIAGLTPGASTGDVQKQVNVLRKSVSDAGKDFRKVEAAKNRIVRTGSKATAASDISLIFNFMKMNDPGSTVREGEFATAQNSAGVPGRIVSAYNNLLEGTRLNPDQRADFVQQSEDLFAAQRQSFDTIIGDVLQQADQDSIPRARVLGDKRLKAFQDRVRTAPLTVGRFTVEEQ